jgi:DNA-binding transcriptional ArsR family regulator
MGLTANEQLDLVFAALSDRTRRSILARLAEGEASVNELVTPSELSQPAISKHLKVLEHARLVTRSSAGRFRPCRLAPAPLRAAAAWLGDYQGFWEASLDRLEEYVDELQGKAPRKTKARKPIARKAKTHRRKTQRNTQQKTQRKPQD